MYKFVLAFRFLLKRRISYFSVFAVALCVFVVFVVMTVLSGLTADFKKKTHLWSGDCVVSTKSLVGFSYYEEFMEVLQKEKEIEAVSAVIKSYAIVKSVPGGNSSVYIDRTLEVIGIEPASYSKVTGFSEWLKYTTGRIQNSFEQSYDVNLPGCIIGIGFLFERDTNGNYIMPEQMPQIKVDVSCFPLTAKGALARAGTAVVSSKIFALSDVAQTGISSDWKSVYLPFEQAQLLCGMTGELKRANALFMKFTDGVGLNAGCSKVQFLWDQFMEDKKDLRQSELLKNVKVQSWKVYNRDMVAVAETQQALMIIVFAMMAVITVFIVFVVFYMIVSHKSKDIGILKSVGISNGNIMLLFLIFAFLIGALGSSIGAVGGWQFLLHINQIEDWLFEHFDFQLWDRELYAIGDIPNSIDWRVLVTIILSAVSACLIGAFLPSRQAGRLQPVETLRVSKL